VHRIFYDIAASPALSVWILLRRTQVYCFFVGSYRHGAGFLIVANVLGYKFDGNERR
jgi:hypothetical protein